MRPLVPLALLVLSALRPAPPPPPQHDNPVLSASDLDDLRARVAARDQQILELRGSVETLGKELTDLRTEVIGLRQVEDAAERAARPDGRAGAAPGQRCLEAQRAAWLAQHRGDARVGECWDSEQKVWSTTACQSIFRDRWSAEQAANAASLEKCR